MGSISDFLELELLDHVFGVGAYAHPATVYVGLSTADPLDTAAGLAEPSGNGYAREACAYGAAASRSITNSGTITFDQASGSWGTITHWAIFDALTSGNMMAHGSFSVPKGVVSGNTPSIAASELDITFSAGDFSTYLANALLDFAFRNTDYSPPTIYLGLATADLSDTTTGATVTECSGNAYVRKAHSAWTTASAGALENNGVITFATPTGTWGLVTAIFIVDSITAGAGNIICYENTVTDQTPTTGDTVQVASGAFDVSLD